MGLEVCGFEGSHVAEAEGKGFGGATAAEELAEVDLADVVAVGGEACGKVGGDVAHEDVLADVDDVAGELDGFGLGDGDAFFGGVGGLDAGERGGVEGGREVEEKAAGEGGEAGVEVVEAGVDEVE